MNNNTYSKQFMQIGKAEGISFLILLFIAMPLKYIAGMPTGVKVVGMIHGVLFVLYVLSLTYSTYYYKWKIKTAILAFLLSLIPFGTFYLKKIIKNVN